MNESRHGLDDYLVVLGCFWVAFVRNSWTSIDHNDVLEHNICCVSFILSDLFREWSVPLRSQFKQNIVNIPIYLPEQAEPITVVHNNIVSQYSPDLTEPLFVFEYHMESLLPNTIQLDAWDVLQDLVEGSVQSAGDQLVQDLISMAVFLYRPHHLLELLGVVAYHPQLGCRNSQLGGDLSEEEIC